MGLERDEGKYVDAERRAARDIDTPFFAVFAFFCELPVLSVGVQRSVVWQTGRVACRCVNILRNRRYTLCAFMGSPSCESSLWL